MDKIFNKEEEQVPQQQGKIIDTTRVVPNQIIEQPHTTKRVVQEDTNYATTRVHKQPVESNQPAIIPDDDTPKYIIPNRRITRSMAQKGPHIIPANANEINTTGPRNYAQLAL